MSANEKQVGGQHYKSASGVEHWDMVVNQGLNYFEGQITKYVMRSRKKNGKQDLEKAMHFLEKYLEVYDKMNSKPADYDFKVPFDLKSYFTEEGHRTDGTTLYTCLRCKAQFWGTQSDAMAHLNLPHKRG